MDNRLNKFVHFSAEGRRLGWQEMLDQRSDQRLPVRVGKTAIYKAVGNILPSFLARQLDDYRFLGQGGEQLVFQNRDGDHVLKLLCDTIGANEDEATLWADDYQRLSDQAGQHLGHHWMETDFMALELPWFHRRYTVASTQPSVSPEAIFSDMQELAFHEPSDDYVGEVLDLYDSICQYNQATGLYPDLYPRNIALTRSDGRPKLQIIDTIPLSAKRLEKPAPGSQTLLRDEVEVNLSILGGLATG